MKITLEWLKEEGACSDGVEWFKEQNKSELKDVLSDLLKQNYASWANWSIVRFMTHKQKVQYAIFSAEQVIEIYEKKYPKDHRPRRAIETAKKWVENPTANAAYAAYAAVYAAYAADAANAAAKKKKLQKKIIEYGLKLLKGEE